MAEVRAGRLSPDALGAGRPPTRPPTGPRARDRPRPLRGRCALAARLARQPAGTADVETPPARAGPRRRRRGRRRTSARCWRCRRMVPGRPRARAGAEWARARCGSSRCRGRARPPAPGSGPATSSRRCQGGVSAGASKAPSGSRPRRGPARGRESTSSCHRQRTDERSAAAVLRVGDFSKSLHHLCTVRAAPNMTLPAGEVSVFL
jgi:hypothetical protein